MVAERVHFDPETGRPLGPDDVEEILQRQQRKAQLLADNREARLAEQAGRFSHVGVELGNSLGELENLDTVHAGLAYQAHAVRLWGKPAAAQILESIAGGIARAAHMRFGMTLNGPELEPSPLNAPKVPREPPTAPVEAPGPDQVPADVTPPAAPPVAPLNAPEPEPDEAPATDEQAELARQFGASFDDLVDDPEDRPSAAEPAVSPEPLDTPLAQAGRARRQAKAANRSPHTSRGA